MGRGSGKGGCALPFQELLLGYQCLIIFTCSIGPGLIIAGIVLLALNSTYGTFREQQILSYNTAVEHFPENSKDFAETLFTFDGRPFARSNKQTSLNDPNPFPTYEQISYALANVHVNNLTYTSFKIIADYPLAGQEIDLGTVLLSNSFTMTPFDLNCALEGECDTLQGNDQAVCKEKFLCPEACDNINGDWDAGTNVCSVTHYLNSVCFKLSQPNGLPWAPDDSYGDTGCYFKGKATAGATGNLDPSVNFWTPALYGPNEVDEIVVTLRHASDPYILASELTQGTFNFGMTYLEAMTNGIIILVVGVAVMIAVIVGDYFLIRYLLSSGRGQKKKFRNGGLESRSLNVPLKPKSEDHPRSHSLPHSAPHHPPKTHIIDIYISPTSKA